jgi:hypothetical protein
MLHADEHHAAAAFDVLAAVPLTTCTTAAGMQSVPNLDLTEWVKMCGGTSVGNECTNSGVCAANTFGIITAQCTAAGWVYRFGDCSPVG